MNTGEMTLTGENRSPRRENFTGATLPTTNPYVDWYGIEPGPQRREAGNYRPSNGKAPKVSRQLERYGIGQ
jgi:hypothetical protein